MERQMYLCLGKNSELAKLSVLSDMNSKIWANFDKDWHKIGILQ
jgi:hypothetical protein